MKLPRLALQVEMSWHHSLVQSVGQSVVTQLSELVGCRLNMDVLFVDTSVQISTYVRESFGCFEMPIERF